MACNKPTTEQGWLDLFNKFKDESKNVAEAVKKAQKFIEENYSFKLPEDATPYVYFGSVDNKIGIWQIVKGISDGHEDQRGYISSTEAGQLFNDRDNFVPALQKAFAGYVKFDNTGSSQTDILYEGTDHTGKITFLDGNTAMSFNDFFSKNYIKNILCDNIHAITAGKPLTKDGMGYNCFIRTELRYIFENKNIKAINGIKKHVFLRPYKENTYESNKFIIDLLKATQVNECTKIHYTASETVKNGKNTTDVQVTYFELPKDTSNISFEFIDKNVLSVSLAQNNKIEDFSSSYKYLEEHYSDNYAYWLGSTLRLGEIEYDMLKQDNADSFIAKYNFDSDAALLYSIQDAQTIRKDHLRALQSESVKKIAPIDVQERADMTKNSKKASMGGFDISRPNNVHYNSHNISKRDLGDQIIRSKQSYNNNNSESSAIYVKRKNRPGKTRTGPTM